MSLTVGVIGLPDVASVLRDAGFDVFGDEGIVSGTRAVSAAFEAKGRDFPVITSSSNKASLKMWLNVNIKRGGPIAMIGLDGPRFDYDYDLLELVVDAPVSLNDVVCALGFGPLDAVLSEAVVDPAGTVRFGSDADTAWGDTDLGVADRVPEPVGTDTVTPGWATDRSDDPAGQFPSTETGPAGEPDETDDLDDLDDLDELDDLADSDDPWAGPLAVEPEAGDTRPSADVAVSPGDGPWGDEPEEQDEIGDEMEEAPEPARPQRPSGPTSGRVVSQPAQNANRQTSDPRGQRPGHGKTPVVVPPRNRPERSAPPVPDDDAVRPPRTPRHARPAPPPVEPAEYDENDDFEDDGFEDDEVAPPPPRTPRRRPPDVDPVTYDEPAEYDDEDDEDVSGLEMFDEPAPRHEPEPTQRPRKRRQSHTDTPVVVVAAFKGGVGKTTMAMSIAQRAADHGAKRVIVVDANRGQSDITTYLRLGRAKLPTIWDAARTGDPRKGFAQPSEINKARHAKLDQIPFGLVLGPPPTKADPRVVTAEVYREVIEVARRASDLVILDTQIIEAHDTSGLIDGLVIPILQSGGWAVAISDLSSASVKNAHAGTDRFKAAGVPMDRLLLLLNRVDASASVDLAELGNSFRDRATLIGSITADAATIQAMNQGQIVSDAPDMVEMFDEILYRITADDVFDPAQHSGFAASGRGFIGRLLGRRR